MFYPDNMDVVDSDELHTQLVCKLYASCAREFYAEKKDK